MNITLRQPSDMASNIHLTTLSFVFVGIACWATVGCAMVEPGTPPRFSEPSPLFDNYKSFATLDELRSRLPDRSIWQIITDVEAPPRASCPRFHELGFTVPAEHLGHKGRLWLTFVNERLLRTLFTLFTPQDFGSYLDALRRTGVEVRDQGVVKIPPATEISIPWTAPMTVAWEDERFGNQVSAYSGACS
jgi:hypothetical protein